MKGQIAATDEFLVAGDLYIASFKMDNVKGIEAFESEVEITSLAQVNGDEIHEEDIEWISKNICEQLKVHNFCHKDRYSELEFQAEAIGDELHRGN